MKRNLIVSVVILFVAVGAYAQTTTPPGTAVGSTSPTESAPVNALPQSNSIRILTPVASQKLSSTNAIEVRFELTNPTAASAGTPNFLVQLDGNDPVRTSSMEQTFTGLAPGPHNVTVQLVDANNTPVAGSRATVQFVVTPPAAPATPPTKPAGPGQSNSPGGLATSPQGSAAPQVGGDANVSATHESVPASGSTLPLISVIGFGVLVGGVASAMKTR